MPRMAAPEQKPAMRIADSARAYELDSSLIGGKAFNLAKLTRAGLPVPPWFCITTLVFRDTFNIPTDELMPVSTASRSDDSGTLDASAIRSAARRISER